MRVAGQSSPIRLPSDLGFTSGLRPLLRWLSSGPGYCLWHHQAQGIEPRMRPVSSPVSPLSALRLILAGELALPDRIVRALYTDHYTIAPPNSSPSVGPMVGGGWHPWSSRLRHPLRQPRAGEVPGSNPGGCNLCICCVSRQTLVLKHECAGTQHKHPWSSWL